MGSLGGRTHLHLGGDEERRDAQQLQMLLTDVLLRQHEAVEEILRQVRRLPVETVHLAHLRTNRSGYPRQRARSGPGRAKLGPHLQQPVQQDGPHLGLQPGVSLQVAAVVEVLELLVEHADPHVVRTGPAASQQSEREAPTAAANGDRPQKKNTHLRWGMGEAVMKRFLKRYCLKLDGSTGSSSLWGVSTRTHGVAPSSGQHL